jgi:HTH-type transcriptional regulator / antitoxin HigA
MPTTTVSMLGASEAPLPLRPIRDERTHEQALREVERLWDAQPGSPEDDRLQVLVLLIEVYERDHLPISPPTPVDAIRFRLEQSDLDTDGLAALLGVSRRRVRDVLAQRTPLTLGMIRLLVERLGISADVLIRGASSSGDHTAAHPA